MQTTIPLLDIANTPYLAFRIKRVKDLNLDKTMKAFKPAYRQILLSLEGRGKYANETKDLHIHGLVCGDDRVPLVKLIKSIYPDAIGNKCYSVSVVRDVKQCVKYTLKEGMYLQKGFPEEFIRVMYRTSTNKENVKAKVASNEEDLVSGDITYKEFSINYMKIKVCHGQNIYTAHIRAYLHRMALDSGEMSYDDYFEENFSLNPRD